MSHAKSRTRTVTLSIVSVVAAVAIAISLGVAAFNSLFRSTGQGAGEGVLIDKSWQVIGIYLSPDTSGTVPDSITQAPSMSFGRQGIVGTSGCASFRALTTYENNGHKSAVEEATALRIDQITWEETRADCDGYSLWAHNHLTRLFAANNNFDLVMDPAGQVVLRLQEQREDSVDSPAIRLAPLSTQGS